MFVDVFEYQTLPERQVILGNRKCHRGLNLMMAVVGRWYLLAFWSSFSIILVVFDEFSLENASIGPNSLEKALYHTESLLIFIFEHGSCSQI